MSEQQRIPAIRVEHEPCPPCDVNPTRVPAIRVQKECCDTDGNGTDEINEDYPWIGYYHLLSTYTFDLSTVAFPNSFWLLVDDNYEWVGTADTIADLLVLLNFNPMELGTFTAVGTTITAVGYHQYELLIPQTPQVPEEPDEEPVVLGCTIFGDPEYDPLATQDDGSCTSYAGPVNYINVICPTFTTGTLEYAPGLFFEWFIEDCNVINDRPVFIALHAKGGQRFSSGPTSWALEFTSRGYYGISADFGFEMDGQFLPSDQKKGAANVCALIRYLRANAVALGINPANIFVGGYSAGGITSVMTNIAADDIDAGDPYWNYSVNSLNPSFSSAPTATVTKAGAVAPPFLTWIDATDRPNYFYHGTLDTTVDYNGAIDTYNGMMTVGIPCTFVPYPGEKHGIQAHHSEMMLGGHLELDGVTVDIGLVAKFAALIVP